MRPLLNQSVVANALAVTIGCCKFVALDNQAALCQFVIAFAKAGEAFKPVRIRHGKNDDRDTSAQSAVRRRKLFQYRWRASDPNMSASRSKLTLLHEMPSPSSDWTARQPHARGWLG